MLLATLSSLALAASSWNATCSASDDASVWFALLQAPTATPSADFDCPGFFLDGAACPQTIGFGKVRPTGQQENGKPLYELRYLPYGNIQSIVTFLDRPGGGVLFTPPVVPGLPASLATSTADLFEQWLEQRARASQPTKDIAIHMWTCPGATFDLHPMAWEALGMTRVTHVGRAPL
jgi:hypothetical protein